MAAVSEIQIGVRMTHRLRNDLQKCADKSGWSLSAQVRYELEMRRGWAHKPYLPYLPKRGNHTG